MELKGKHNIKLNHIGDGRVFLNYWDWAHGNDIVCQVVDNKLLLTQHAEDEHAEDLPPKEIDFAEFFRLVNRSISEIRY